MRRRRPRRALSLILSVLTQIRSQFRYRKNFKYLYYCNTYMPTKTNNYVDYETWRKLKVLAAEHDTTMGKILKKITEDYNERNRNFWDNILKGEKIITDKEAKEHEDLVKKR